MSGLLLSHYPPYLERNRHYNTGLKRWTYPTMSFKGGGKSNLAFGPIWLKIRPNFIYGYNEHHVFDTIRLKEKVKD